MRASERANGRVSGPALMSRFMALPNHGELSPTDEPESRKTENLGASLLFLKVKPHPSLDLEAACVARNLPVLERMK